MATKKTIEIDASGVKKALASMEAMSKASQAMAKSVKEQLKLFDQMASKQKAAASAAKDHAEAIKKQNKAYAEQKKALDDLRREYEKTKRERDSESSGRIREASKPQRGFFSMAERYKGMRGAVLRFGERSQEEWEERSAQMKEGIAEKQRERSEASSAFEKAMAERAAMEKDKNATPQKKAAKTRAVKAAKQNLEAADEAVRASQEEYAKEAGAAEGKAGEYAAIAAAASKLEDTFERIGKAAMDFVLKPFKEIANKVKSMITELTNMETGMATFSSSTSLVTNAAAREQQLKYGLGASANFGFTQAKQILGIQSDEDLMYMNSRQRDRLLSYMDRYSKWYDKLENSGALDAVQDMQLEMEEFRRELAMEFLQWVADNKDTIMSVMKATLAVVRAIAEAIMKIITLFGGKTQSLYDASFASDRLGSSSTENKSTNITINANTTNNATGVLGSREALDEFSKENWSKLAKQIVSAVGG